MNRSGMFVHGIWKNNPVAVLSAPALGLLEK
jgi:hypothetical protein